MPFFPFLSLHFFISFLFPFFFLCFFIQIPFDFFIGSLHCLWGQLVKVLDIHWKMTNTLVPAIFKFWNTWVSSLNRDLLFPLKFGSPVFFSCPSGHPQAALPPISQAQLQIRFFTNQQSQETKEKQVFSFVLKKRLRT